MEKEEEKDVRELIEKTWMAENNLVKNLSTRSLDDLERLYWIVNNRMSNFPICGIVSDDIYWSWFDVRQAITRLFVGGI